MTGERELFGFKEEQYKAMVRDQAKTGGRIFVRSDDGRERIGGERIIIAFFPHHVMVEDSGGFRECYQYLDIYRWLNKIILLDDE